MSRPLLRLGVYGAVAAVVTWPLVLDPAGQVVGAPRSDVWNSLWGLWFVERQGGPWPAFTDLLDYPAGGRIVVADPLNALLALPVVALAGPVVAYAVLVLAHLTFAGLAADALGRAAGGRGWLAGLAWQLAPIGLANLNNGSSEAIATGWLPLACWAAIRAVERPSWGRTLGAGAALATCALGGWYAGVGAWLFLASVLVGGWGPTSLRERLLRLLPVMALALVVTLPVARGVRAVALAADGLVDIKQTEDLARIRRTIGAADPRVFVAPGSFRSPDFARLEGNPGDFVHTAYLGFALLALAVAGSRRGPARAWWLAVAGSLVLAMGPVVVVDGRPLDLLGRSLALPLPYRLLEPLPGFESLSLLYRLAGMASLGLAVLADRLHPGWAGLVAAEVLLLSPTRGLPPVTAVPSPGALAAIAHEPGAVLNLPPTAARAYLYEQVLHGRPLVGSVNTGLNRAGLEVARAARAVRGGEAPPETLQAVAREQGVHWVVVHRDVLMDDEWVAVAGALARHAHELSADGRFRVYDLWADPGDP